jgi:cation transport ATPase
MKRKYEKEMQRNEKEKKKKEKKRKEMKRNEKKRKETKQKEKKRKKRKEKKRKKTIEERKRQEKKKKKRKEEKKKRRLINIEFISKIISGMETHQKQENSSTEQCTLMKFQTAMITSLTWHVPLLLMVISNKPCLLSMESTSIFSVSPSLSFNWDVIHKVCLGVFTSFTR